MGIASINAFLFSTFLCLYIKYMSPTKKEITNRITEIPGSFAQNNMDCNILRILPQTKIELIRLPPMGSILSIFLLFVNIFLLFFDNIYILKITYILYM